MPVENCSVDACTYKTNDYPVTDALDALRLHVLLAHPGLLNATTPQQAQKQEKPKRPSLQMNPGNGQSCDEGMWDFFITKFDAYARSCNIQPARMNDCFRECLPEEVQYMVHNTYGKDVEKQDEVTLKANVRMLVVMAKSRVASVVEMKAIRQQPEEKAEAFLARLRSAGRRIGFKKTKKCTCTLDVEVDYTDDVVRDEFIAGLADDEIRSELMKVDVKTLDDALKLVMAHEMAKRSQQSLTTPESANKLSSYKKNKRQKNEGSSEKGNACHY